jgi:ubiquitin fusion degradation protein 1
MMSGKERHDVDKGGKSKRPFSLSLSFSLLNFLTANKILNQSLLNLVILPASALDHLTRLHIQFPMLFKLVNKAKNRTTHCGVLEFVAEEGRCYLPYWMMKNLLVTEGDLVQVEYISLLTAKFVKFQPQSVDFLEISNPKAV